MLSIDYSGFQFVLKLVLFGFLFLRIPRIFAWFRKFKILVPLVWGDICRTKMLREQGKEPFGYFGVRMFCGRQGSGKTTALVWYLDKIRKEFPNVKVYTNFDYLGQEARLNSLNDLLKYRNGEQGVVFALDEIQNEFSSASSRNFPETLLSALTMQRKQRVCILATSQVFGRVAKPLREQCYQVVECKTFLHRWTKLKAFDADDYNKVIDNPDPMKRLKLPKIWRESFVQTDILREKFDTYEIVNRLSRQGFVARYNIDSDQS